MKPFDWLHLLRNSVDFPLRQLFHWRRGGPRTVTEPKDGLFNGKVAEDEAALRKTYRLGPFTASSTQLVYQVGLYYLQMLERGLNESKVTLPSEIIAAEIGPSDWFYVQPLVALLRHWNCTEARRIHLTGYEVDAYRVYADLYSRYDHAISNIAGLEGVRYLPEAFTRQPESCHIILMMFPFVFIHDHLEWGLPGKIFSPQRLLADAWDSLLPGGVLLIANQSLEEHIQQKKMMAAQDIHPGEGFKHESPFMSYEHEHYVVTAVK